MVAGPQPSGLKACWVNDINGSWRPDMQWSLCGTWSSGALGGPLVPRFHWDKFTGRWGSFVNHAGGASRCLIQPETIHIVKVLRHFRKLGRHLTVWPCFPGLVWPAFPHLPGMSLASSLEDAIKKNYNLSNSQGLPVTLLLWGFSLWKRWGTQGGCSSHTAWTPTSLAQGQGCDVQEGPHWQRLKSNVTLQPQSSTSEPDGCWQG